VVKVGFLHGWPDFQPARVSQSPRAAGAVKRTKHRTLFGLSPANVQCVRGIDGQSLPKLADNHQGGVNRLGSTGNNAVPFGQIKIEPFLSGFSDLVREIPKMLASFVNRQR
jgi:hypothetical protein